MRGEATRQDALFIDELRRFFERALRGAVANS